MSLRDATPPRNLPPGPPYLCRELAAWDFDLVPSDPRLMALHAGEPESIPEHAYLAGNVSWWADEGLDSEDPSHPMFQHRRSERDLYLRHWERHVPEGCRVLDLGGGVGRFTRWCLDRGCEVELADPDLHALRAAVRRAAGGPGRLDVHWATGEALPTLDAVDVVLLVEVLNYCEDPARVLANARRVLRPGGVLLVSVEARWGWAMAEDVVPGTLDALLTDGAIHAPGDRFVRTFDEAGLHALLAGWKVECVPTHYVLSGPFQRAAGARSLDEIVAIEERLRAHPVLALLHRAWTVIAHG